MKITYGKVFKAKNEWDNENILCPRKDYDRNTYWNLRLLFRTLSSLPVLYLLGNYLYYFSKDVSEIKIIILEFIAAAVISYFLIQIPKVIIVILLMPGKFKNKDFELKFFYRKRLLTYSTTTFLTPINYNLIIIIPLLLFICLPVIFLLVCGLKLYLLAFLQGAVILISEDLLNYFLQFSSYNEDDKITLYEPVNEYHKTDSDFIKRIKSFPVFVISKIRKSSDIE